MATDFKKHYITSYYDGKMFEFSATEKEGYERHINTKGTESFRKYYKKGVEGTLQYISLRKNEKKNNAEELVVTLKNEDEKFYITYNVMDTKGDSIDEFTEALIRVLPKMEKGQVYNLYNWKMNKGDLVNGKVIEYGRSGVVVKTAGTKIEPVLNYKSEKNPDGEIPRIVWKETAGKNRPSAASKEEKLEYLYTVLQQQVERLKFDESQSVNQSQQQSYSSQEPTQQKPAQQITTVDSSKSFIPPTINEDDLPF